MKKSKSENLHVFFSNQVESCYQHLKKALFYSSAPFAKRVVIVPSPAMKTWLQFQMANDPEIGIAMGIEVQFLAEAVPQLQKLFSSDTSKHFPPHLELSLVIEDLMASAPTQGVWLPLKNYLASASTSKIRQKRIVRLSDQIARLFLQYGQYAPSMVKEWEMHPTCWQGALWQQIYHKSHSFDYPYRQLTRFEGKFLQQEVQVHLFAMSFISKLHHLFFTKLATLTPVYYWMLSPCQLFWSDICSEKEAYRLLHRLKFAPTNQIQDLELFLRERNLILANFGKLGREMLKQIEESSAVTQDEFVITKELMVFNQYEEIVTDDIKTISAKPTLLHALQADLTLLRCPKEEHEKLNLDANDRSIQVHVAVSCLREVQILYDQLLKMIEKDHIRPQDIIVMAPQIADYEPYIRMIFENDDSLLDCHIMDLKLLNQSSLTRGFLHLLALSESRFDVHAILQLFEHPAFQKKHQLKLSDVIAFRAWAQEAHIYWGEDLSHKQTILRKTDFSDAFGTWEQGIQKLVLGLAMLLPDDEEAFSLDLFPHPHMEFSKAELLGKCIHIFEKIKQDLKCLHDRSLKDWTCFLTDLLTSHFEEESSDFESLIAIFKDFHAASHTVSATLFSYETIRHHLEKALMEKEYNFQTEKGAAVRFCSMLPMRAVPASVIAFLGMSEEAFPRSSSRSSLDVIKQADYIPSASDFDRYLFLEAILSARHYFLILYKTESNSPPSLLVTELLSYLDDHFLLGSVKPSEVCHLMHPFHAFDYRYFIQNSPFFSYSVSNFKKASAFYKLEKKKSKNFVPKFLIPMTDYMVKETWIDLASIEKMLRHPIRTYLNQTMQIYLNRHEKKLLKSQEELQANYFQLSHLEKKGVTSELTDPVIQAARKQGKLPPGRFLDLSTLEVKTNINQIKENLLRQGISSQDLFQIEFHPICKTAEKLPSGDWLLPPIQVKIGDQLVHLYGKMPFVTPFGLLHLGKSDFTSIIPSLPYYAALAYQRLLPLENRLLFSEATQEKPALDVDFEKFLQKIVDYYFLASHQLSPLMPKWIEPILNEDVLELQKQFNPLFTRFPDAYLDFAFTEQTFPEIEKTIQDWKRIAESLFSEIKLKWYP